MWTDEISQEAFSSVVCAANTANRVVGLTRIEANVCKDDESYVETLELRSTALTEGMVYNTTNSLSIF